MLPFFECLNGSFVLQRLLWQMLVVEEDVTLKRECQIFTRLETMRGQHIRDSAIEPFNHAIGLWVFGLGQAMFDVERA